MKQTSAGRILWEFLSLWQSKPPEDVEPKAESLAVTVGAYVMNGTAEGPGQVYYGVWFGQDDPRNSIVLMQDRCGDVYFQLSGSVKFFSGLQRV